MATGDLLLFTEKPHDVIDWSIGHWTGGQFVHVEVQVDEKQSIGELSFGLNEHPIPTNRGIVTVYIKRLYPHADIQAGLEWVKEQDLAAIAKQRHYGFKDIFNDAMKVLHIPWEVPEEDNEWDCSHFATLYLIHANAAGELAKDPSTVSPNDIARAFGILPKYTEATPRYR